MSTEIMISVARNRLLHAYHLFCWDNLLMLQIYEGTWIEKKKN